jgi:hypothetical protein
MTGATITSSTNLNLLHTSATSLNWVSWQVVQYDDCIVQRGTLNFTSTDTTLTFTPNTAVRQDKTAVFLSYKSSGTAANAAIHMMRAQLEDAGGISVIRNTSGATASAYVEVVNFWGEELVREAPVTIASSGTSITHTHSAITDTTKAVAYSAGRSNSGGTTTITTGDTTAAFAQATVSSTTTTTQNRQTAQANASTYSSQVIQFSDNTLAQTRRIDSGNLSAGYTWANGIQYFTDRLYTGGGFFYYGAGWEPPNTVEDNFYMTVHYDTVPFSYRLPLANGTYVVDLHFYDERAVGERTFHVDIQGTRVLNTYCPAAEFGVKNAGVKSFLATVSNNELTILFTHLTHNASISGIEVEPGAGTPNVPIAVTIGGVTTNATSPNTQATAPNVSIDVTIGAVGSTATHKATTPGIDVPVSIGGLSGLARVSATAPNIAIPVSIGAVTTSTVVGAAPPNIDIPVSIGAISGLARVSVTAPNVDIPVTIGATSGLARISISAPNISIPVSIGAASGLARVSAQAPGVSIPVTIGGVTTTATTPATTIRIDCGNASTFTDSSSNLWAADAYFTGGALYNWGNAIAGTTNDTLYNTVRWDYSGFSYAIPVSNGNYTVKLYWYDPEGANLRKTHVDIEGVRVLTDHSPSALYGVGVPGVTTHSVTVTGGSLDIVFTASLNDAEISAIEVIQASNASQATVPVHNIPVSIGGVSTIPTQTGITPVVNIPVTIGGTTTNATHKTTTPGVSIPVTIGALSSIAEAFAPGIDIPVTIGGVSTTSTHAASIPGVSIPVSIGAATTSATHKATTASLAVPVTIGAASTTASHQATTPALSIPVSIGALSSIGEALPPVTSIPVSIGAVTTIETQRASAPGVSIPVTIGAVGSGGTAQVQPPVASIPVSIGGVSTVATMRATTPAVTIPVSIGGVSTTPTLLAQAPSVSVPVSIGNVAATQGSQGIIPTVAIAVSIGAIGTVATQRASAPVVTVPISIGGVSAQTPAQATTPAITVPVSIGGVSTTATHKATTPATSIPVSIGATSGLARVSATTPSVSIPVSIGGVSAVARGTASVPNATVVVTIGGVSSVGEALPPSIAIPVVVPTPSSRVKVSVPGMTVAVVPGSITTSSIATIPVSYGGLTGVRFEGSKTTDVVEKAPRTAINTPGIKTYIKKKQ